MDGERPGIDPPRMPHTRPPIEAANTVRKYAICSMPG
jgi:hypothetical protein